MDLYFYSFQPIAPNKWPLISKEAVAGYFLDMYVSMKKIQPVEDIVTYIILVLSVLSTQKRVL